MKKVDKLSDISINDWLFIKSLEGSDIEIRNELIKYFNLEKVNVSKVEIFLKKIKDILSEEKTEYKLIKTFYHKGIKYGIIPNLNDILVSEWIDLDNSSEDILTFLSILYRPIIRKFNIFNRNYNIVKYKESHEDFGDLSMEIYLGVLAYYSNFKMEVIQNLEYLYPVGKTESNNILSNMSFSAEQGFAEQYNWYNLLYTAANEQYLNMSKVLDTNAIEFLEFVNYYIRKQELEFARINRENK